MTATEIVMEKKGQLLRAGLLLQLCDQKLNFIANCTMRGSRVEVTVLNAVDAKLVEAQQIGLVWLNALNDSARNCPVKRSVNLMFLKRDKSVTQYPGARIAP